MDSLQHLGTSRINWLRYRYLLAAVALMFFCSSAVADNVKSSPGKEIQVSGTEQWIIANTRSHIDGTMLVKLGPNPLFLYVIRVFVLHDPGKQDKPMARRVARYALANGYFARAKAIKINNKPVQLAPKVGVAIVHKTPGLLFSSFKGYKFLFRLSELEKSLN